MGDVFSALAARALGLAPIVRPSRPPRFAPTRPPGDEDEGRPGEPPASPDGANRVTGRRPGAPSVDPPEADRPFPAVRVVEATPEPAPEARLDAPRSGPVVGAQGSPETGPAGPRPTTRGVEAPDQAPPSRRPAPEPSTAPPRTDHATSPSDAGAEVIRATTAAGPRAPTPPGRDAATGTARAAEPPALRHDERPGELPAPPHAPAHTPPSGPVSETPRPVEVWVTIGRVEVRTSPRVERTPRPAPAPPPGPRLSLQDYLRRGER